MTSGERGTISIAAEDRGAAAILTVVGALAGWDPRAVSSEVQGSAAQVRRDSRGRWCRSSIESLTRNPNLVGHWAAFADNAVPNNHAISSLNSIDVAFVNGVVAQG